MSNLVIVMAGDMSLHEKFADNRDFELWVCFWGNDDAIAARYAASCDRLFRIKGQKWEIVRALGRIAHEQGLPAFSTYDHVFLPDDDIEFPGGSADVSRALAIAAEIGADIFQPAVANGNFAKGWEAVSRIDGLSCHATTLAEIMMPAYSGAIFENCLLPILHVRGFTTAGWGIEPVIARFAEYHLGRPVRTFVLDEAPAIHTRPIGAGTSAYKRGMDEAFLNPFAFAFKMKELARFATRAEAAAFQFPPTDETIDWKTVERHMLRVRGARIMHRLGTEKGLAAMILKNLQKLAGRFLPEQDRL